MRNKKLYYVFAFLLLLCVVFQFPAMAAKTVKNYPLTAKEITDYRNKGYLIEDIFRAPKITLEYDVDVHLLLDLKREDASWEEIIDSIKETENLIDTAKKSDLTKEERTEIKMVKELLDKGLDKSTLFKQVFEAKKKKVGLETLLKDVKVTDKKATTDSVSDVNTLTANTLVASTSATTGSMTSLNELYKDSKNFAPLKPYFGNINEQIDPDSGSLSIRQTDLVLPGKNGFDLRLERTYNSAKANLFTPECLVAGPDLESAVRNKVYGFRHNAIGVGWEWNFPYIERTYDDAGNQTGTYLHMGDGRQFTCGSSDPNYSLGDYKIKDMTLKPDYSGTAFTNGVDKSAQFLELKDGKKYYFASDGVLIGITDRYKNKITFQYRNYYGYRVISSITDSCGRVVNFEYYGSQVVVKVGGRQFNLNLTPCHTISYTGEVIMQLYSVQDVNNKLTYYNYSKDAAPFAFPDSNSGDTNYYLNLREIHYPTGAYSEYTYKAFTKTFDAIGAIGGNEPGSSSKGGSLGYFRVANRKDWVYNPDDYLKNPNISPYATNSKSFSYENMTTTVTDDPNNGDSDRKKIVYNYTYTQETEPCTNPAKPKGRLNTSTETWRLSDNTKIEVKETAYTEPMRLPVQEIVKRLQGNSTTNFITLKKNVYTYNEYGDLLQTDEYNGTGTLIDRKITNVLDANRNYTLFHLPREEYKLKTAAPANNKGEYNVTSNTFDANGNIVSQYTKLVRRPLNATETLTGTTSFSVYGTGSNTSILFGSMDKIVVQITLPGRGNSGYSLYYRKDGATDWTLAGSYSSYSIETKTHTINVGTDVCCLIRVDASTQDSTAVTQVKASSYTNYYETILEQTAKTYYVYNAQGNVTEKHTEKEGSYWHSGSGDDSNCEITRYEYNSANVENKGGWPTENYDGAFVTKVTDKVTIYGVKTDVVTQKYYDIWGNVKRVIDPRNNETKYEYDNYNRVTKEIYPGGVDYKTYDYGTPGRINCVTITNENKHTKKYYYDSMDRLYSIEDGIVVNGHGQTIYKVGYDLLGNKIWEEDALARRTKYKYDCEGQVTLVTNPDNSTTEYKYLYGLNTNTGATQIVKDIKGTKLRYTRIDNGLSGKPLAIYKQIEPTYYQAKFYEYDAAGNVVKEYKPVIQIPAGNIETATSFTSPVNDSRNAAQTIVYSSYGADNRLLETWDSVGSQDKVSYTYAKNGKVKTKGYTPSGSTTRSNIIYTYNEQGLITRIDYPDGKYATFKSDKAGNTIESYDSGSNVTEKIPNPDVDIDARGRVKKTAIIVDGRTFTTSYNYDAANNINSMTYPNGETITFTYDANEKLKTIPGYLTNMDYKADGFMYTMTYANGLITTYTPDSLGRVDIIQNTNTKFKLDYGYDEFSNVTSLATTLPTNATASTVYTANDSFGYDYLDQLTSFTQNGISTSYIYDIRGNRMTKNENGVFTTYTYDLNDRIKTVSLPTYRTFGYDGRGNVVSKSDGTVYTYDWENRLLKASKNGSTILENFYNTDGIRVKKVENGVKTYYVYAGDNCIAELDDSKNSWTNYIIAGSQRIASNTNNTKEFYLNDAQGSVKVVTDATGNITSSSVDKPFGEDVAGVGFGPKEEFRFTGKGKDESVGLFYFNARWYDPELGRFIQKDPAEDGDNYYVYCENNPLKYTDSTGKYTDREYNDAYNYFSTHGWYGYGSIPLSTAADAYRRGKKAIVVPRPNNKWVIKEFDDSIKDLDKETYELFVNFATMGEFKELEIGGKLLFKTGKAAEEFLFKQFGGKAQAFYETSLGRRFIDLLVKKIANESKVGYATLTKFIKKQILKDAELIKAGRIDKSVWHFFKSGVTGKGGASKQLIKFLKDHGIDHIMHK